MAAKELYFGDKTRNNILHGIDKLANAVKATLGPRGRNVILDKPFGSALSTCVASSADQVGLQHR